MIAVVVKDGVVINCVAVNSFDDLRDYYPEHILLEQVGEENVGWTYDGATFSPPVGG